MKLSFLCFLSLFLFVRPIYAAQSSIAEAEGSACMSDDKSRKQTEQAALNDAKKKAAEFVSTQIRSESEINNFELKKDLLSSYANADVKILKELEKRWYKDVSYGDCYKIKIRAEIVPITKAVGEDISLTDSKHLYDLQERCKQNAERLYNDQWDVADLGLRRSFKNHYNIKLSKCYLYIWDEGAEYLIDVNDNNMDMFSRAGGSPRVKEWDASIKDKMED